MSESGHTKPCLSEKQLEQLYGQYFKAPADQNKPEFGRMNFKKFTTYKPMELSYSSNTSR